MKKFADRLYIFLILFLTLMLPVKSAVSSEAVKSGIEICFSVLIPSLFPFIFFSSLLSCYAGSVISALFSGLISPVFNISPAAASSVVLGTLGGFPTGAAVASELYSEKKITKSEAELLPVFSNNAGIMFVLFAVGEGVFKSVRTGAALYTVHLLSSLITGILMRPGGKCTQKKEPVKKALSSFSPGPIYRAFSKCIFSSVRSMAAICANFLVWRTVSFILFSTAEGTLFAVGKGLLEMTGGLFSLGSAPSFPAAALILGFNGLCIHMQTASVFFSSGLSPAKCILGKCISAAVSFALALAVCDISAYFPVLFLLAAVLTGAVLLKKGFGSATQSPFPVK